MLKIREIKAKSIITKLGLDVDYVKIKKILELYKMVIVDILYPALAG